MREGRKEVERSCTRKKYRHKCKSLQRTSTDSCTRIFYRPDAIPVTKPNCQNYSVVKLRITRPVISRRHRTTEADSPSARPFWRACQTCRRTPAFPSAADREACCWRWPAADVPLCSPGQYSALHWSPRVHIHNPSVRNWPTNQTTLSERGCKNRPAPFHGRMSYKATIPDSGVFDCVLRCSLGSLVVLFCVICVFCLLVVLVKLPVPVQVIDWKDSSPKWPIMCWLGLLIILTISLNMEQSLI